MHGAVQGLSALVHLTFYFTAGNRIVPVSLG